MDPCTRRNLQHLLTERFYCSKMLNTCWQLFAYYVTFIYKILVECETTKEYCLILYQVCQIIDCDIVADCKFVNSQWRVTQKTLTRHPIGFRTFEIRAIRLYLFVTLICFLQWKDVIWTSVNYHHGHRLSMIKINERIETNGEV